MVLHPFKACFPNPAMITSPDSFFGRVKEEYPHFYKSGFFKKFSQNAIYLCKITKPEGISRAVVAVNDFSDFELGNIFKHEDTLDAKEQNTLELLLWRKAQIKPVLLAYENDVKLDQWMDNYTSENPKSFSYYFNESDEINEVWAVTDESDIDFIRDTFHNNIKHGYIADGHHRCATLTKLKNSGALEKVKIPGILSIYIPFSDLQIYEYNRLVEMPIGLNSTVLVAELAKYFNIEVLNTPRKPKEKHEIVCIIGKDWLSLKWKPQIIDSFLKNDDNDFDANLLNKLVLRLIFKIENAKTDLSINYFEGSISLRKIEKSLIQNENLVAFLLYPISKDDLIAVASQGRNLPPKSTWFEPRIKNGLLVLELEG